MLKSSAFTLLEHADCRERPHGTVKRIFVHPSLRREFADYHRCAADVIGDTNVGGGAECSRDEFPEQ